MDSFFNNIYKGKKVFITGHTGFKGSWLAYWLTQLGANVCGYSLSLPSSPSHFDLLKLSIESHFGDIRDLSHLEKVIEDFNPDIIFHLAAQPLVRLSYKEPLETFETNVMGSLKVYQAAKKANSLKAFVSITTDKVYENKEWQWGYREIDGLGGKDPYSASKAAMEIVSRSFQESFWNVNDYQKTHHVLFATVRAGNVIGGGDWALDRLIPDIVMATINKKSVEIRRPNAVRPWQHVLEPLSGYLLLGQHLLEGKKEFATPFNFGPLADEDKTVADVLSLLKNHWPEISFQVHTPKENFHEAGLLKLDCSKAANLLKWKPIWDTSDSLRKTILWYRSFYENKRIETQSDLTEYLRLAKEKKVVWAQ